MQIPIKKFKKLYHVGHLEGQPGLHVRSSYEGPCLSVSEVPNAWRSIAQLGGAPLWELRKAENQFLAVHRMSKVLQNAVVQWGLGGGYVENHEGWITELDTDDGEAGRHALSETREIAEQDWGPDEEVAGRYARIVPFATPKLEIFARQTVDLLLVPDMLTLAYAELVLGLDGVFWNEELDVFGLSAPRAGIFAGKLSSWSVVRLASEDNPNEREY
jgi:hypothetical protein